jgi:hypothetical protein
MKPAPLRRIFLFLMAYAGSGAAGPGAAASSFLGIPTIKPNAKLDITIPRLIRLTGKAEFKSLGAQVL